MDFLNQLFGDINSVLWGVFVLIPLLCGTGIFYTFKLRFVQIRLFPTALRFLFNNATLFGKRADQTGMSSFQALATAVAAQVGTGNVRRHRHRCGRPRRPILAMGRGIFRHGHNFCRSRIGTNLSCDRRK